MNGQKQLLQICNDRKVPFRTESPLAGYTTFSIGGPCPFLLEPESESQVTAIFEVLRQFQMPYYVLGKGSNVLFPDSRFEAVVVHLGSRFSKMTRVDETHVSAQSGALLLDFSRFAAEQALAGMEFSYGIPGSVGGAVYMNAGAYGGEMKDIVSSCIYLDRDGNVQKCRREDLHFSYRHSFLTENGGVLLGAQVELALGNQAEILTKMENYMQARRSKQPLEYPSAGSTFKRPVGNYASALIDQCNLKGRMVGGAQVSEKHAGFIINRGGATCSDVLQLIAVVQREVFSQTGYELECEVKVAEPIGWESC